MSWHLKGTYFENCNCDMVCPCTVSGLTLSATADRCYLVLSFHVDDGNVDGVDVSGKTVVVVCDTPPVMADGNWRVGVIMDASASPEQAHKLGDVFGGKVGGPMSMLAPFIGEMIGMETAQIEYKSEGRLHSVKAGDFVDIEIEDYVAPGNPTGEVASLKGMLHPANSNLTIATATRSTLNAFGLSGVKRHPTLTPNRRSILTPILDCVSIAGDGAAERSAAA
ncbi:MAG: hypothetical protein ACI89J_002970 [Hyphomicrobiaceae bacterium]|jgi:hypothetical protein